jgi:hypothetical protein
MHYTSSPVPGFFPGRLPASFPDHPAVSFADQLLDDGGSLEAAVIAQFLKHSLGFGAEPEAGGVAG